MKGVGDEIKSKQASKKDRTLLTFAQSPKDSRIGSMFSTASQEVTDLSSWLV